MSKVIIFALNEYGGIGMSVGDAKNAGLKDAKLTLSVNLGMWWIKPPDDVCEQIRELFKAYGQATTHKRQAMEIVKYRIPATKDQGPCVIVGINSLDETAMENALWEYNSIRAHDEQPPLYDLPQGTVAESTWYNK